MTVALIPIDGRPEDGPGRSPAVSPPSPPGAEPWLSRSRPRSPSATTGARWPTRSGAGSPAWPAGARAPLYRGVLRAPPERDARRAAAPDRRRGLGIRRGIRGDRGRRRALRRSPGRPPSSSTSPRTATASSRAARRPDPSSPRRSRSGLAAAGRCRLALTHVDPRRPDAAGAVERLAASTGGFLVGGLTAAAGETSHESGGRHRDPERRRPLAPRRSRFATALSQGCTPLGRAHEVTRGKGQSPHRARRPAARSTSSSRTSARSSPSDLRQVGGLIFAALPVAGSDTADYTGAQPRRNRPRERNRRESARRCPRAERVLFCRRDRETAVGDMRRMAEDPPGGGSKGG